MYSCSIPKEIPEPPNYKKRLCLPQTCILPSATFRCGQRQQQTSKSPQLLWGIMNKEILPRDQKQVLTKQVYSTGLTENLHNWYFSGTHYCYNYVFLSLFFFLFKKWEFVAILFLIHYGIWKARVFGNCYFIHY